MDCDLGYAILAGRPATEYIIWFLLTGCDDTRPADDDVPAVFAMILV